MKNDTFTKDLIKEFLGNFALVEEVELVLPFKKETIYKKLKQFPEAALTQNNGYIIINVDIFLDYLFI